MNGIRSQAINATFQIQTLKPRRSPSPLKMISYRVFIVPILMMVVGGLIWGLTALLQPTNLSLILLGQVIFAIGMFVAIILGFWVMTIIRMPTR